MVPSWAHAVASTGSGPRPGASVAAAQAVAQQSQAVDWGDLSPGGPRVADAPTDVELTIYFGFADKGVEDFARSVSSPDSVSYGKYLSLTDSVDAFGADSQEEAAVTTALAAVGATQNMGATRTFTRSTMTIGQAEKLFGVTIGIYDATGGGQEIAPDSQPTLPANLDGVIADVFGLVQSWSSGDSSQPFGGPSWGGRSPRRRILSRQLRRP